MEKFVSTMYDAITQGMEKEFPERVAFRYYTEETDMVTTVLFKELAQDVRRTVTYLQSTIPDAKGKKVCLLSKNSYEYVVNTFGAIMAGCVLVPMNQRKSGAEMSHELELVEPAAILTDGDDYGCNEEMQAAYGSLLRPMDAYKAYEPAELVNRIQPEELMVLMFTSGTTGRSKGVMLSQKNLFTAMPAFLTPFEDVRSQTGWNTDAFSSLSCLPMFHISAMTSLVSWSVTGHCVNLCNDLKYFYRDVGAMRSDVMAVVPVLLKSIYHDVMKGKRERLNGLRMLTCGAAMFDPAMLQDLMDRGFFIAQMYGLTETCGDGAWNSSQEEKYLTSVGHVDDSCQYKLEDGELCMRGDPVMLGYYKDPEATAEVIDADCWFHTGDLARKDEDGYYFLTGRKKNLIILDSGENVSPEELEGIVGKCEAVKECVVKEMGKKIGVVVYCDEDKQQQVRDFITEANRTLPLYKRMSAVEFSTEPLPRNGAGKLLRQ